MPSFTIYVTGGVEWFYATLNAVAMFFNDGEFIWEVALMGALFAIMTGAWFYIQKNLGSGLLRAHTWIEHAVMMSIVLALAFVPTRVTVQDIYGEMNATPVDNVPLIFSLPAAIFSGISYELFKSMDTAFASTSGSYMSVSDQGFATPLKLLFAMRGGLSNTSSDLAASFQYYLVDCTKNSPVNSRGVATSPDLFQYLIDNGRDTGLTRTLISSSGSPGGGTGSLSEPTPVSCAQAKILLQQRFDVFENGAGAGNSDVDRLINYNVQQADHAGSGGTGGYNYANYENAFNHLLGFTGQNAQQFMRTALVRNLVNDTYRCGNAAYNEAAFTNCTQIQNDAMEAYKVDAAGGANLFTKTMFPAMTLLQLMFFAFGVIIFLYGLLRGAGVVMYLAKYFVFGVWVFSWLPFVAVINAFIQWMVERKIQQLPAAGLTSENYATYMYDVLSTNLATASDMLAATPLLTLGLLTGSAYAIAGVAGRLSARDYVDESQAAPRTGTVQPLVQTTPMHMSNAATGIHSADYSPYKLSYSDSSGDTERSAHQQAVQSQWSQLRAYSDAHSRVVTSLSGQTITNSDGVVSELSRNKLVDQMYNAGNDYARRHNISQEDVNSAALRANAELGISGSASAGLQAMGNGVAAGVSGKGSMGAEESRGYKASAALSAGASEVLGFMRKSGVGYANRNASQLSDVVSTLGGTTGADAQQSLDRYEQAASESETATRTWSSVQEASRSSGTSLSLTADQFGAAIERDDIGAGYGYSWSERISQKYRDMEQTHGAGSMNAARAQYEDKVTQGGTSVVPNSDVVSQFLAIGRFDPVFKNEIIAEATGSAPVSAGYAQYRGIASDAEGIHVSNDIGGADGALGSLGRATGHRSQGQRDDGVLGLDERGTKAAEHMLEGETKIGGRFNRNGGKEIVGNLDSGTMQAAQTVSEEAARKVYSNHNPMFAKTIDDMDNAVYGKHTGSESAEEISQRTKEQVKAEKAADQEAKRQGGRRIDMAGDNDAP